MLHEYRPHGGGGKGKPGRASAKREHYADPTGVHGLHFYTVEPGRELRLHTGLDYPPKDKVDALLVMTFGVKKRKPELLPHLTAAIEGQDWEARMQPSKRCTAIAARCISSSINGVSRRRRSCAPPLARLAREICAVTNTYIIQE